MKENLSKKEIVFCRLKAEGKSDIEAAEQAGFLKQTGEKLSKQERIQKEIMRQLKEKKKQKRHNQGNSYKGQHLIGFGLQC